MNLILMKSKNNALLINVISLSFCLISTLIIFIFSFFHFLKIIVIIGLFILLISYFSLIINVLFLFINRNKFLFINRNKFLRMTIFSIFPIPFSYFIIAITVILIMHFPIPNLHMSTFYVFYPLFYLIPILFIVLSLLIYYNFYLKEKKFDNSFSTTFEKQTVFAHSDCSICLKNSLMQ